MEKPQEDFLSVHMKKQEIIDRLRKENYRITNQRMLYIAGRGLHLLQGNLL